MIRSLSPDCHFCLACTLVRSCNSVLLSALSTRIFGFFFFYSDTQKSHNRSSSWYSSILQSRVQIQTHKVYLCYVTYTAQIVHWLPASNHLTPIWFSVSFVRCFFTNLVQFVAFVLDQRSLDVLRVYFYNSCDFLFLLIVLGTRDATIFTRWALR